MVNDFYGCPVRASERPFADNDCDEPVVVWLGASETRPVAGDESDLEVAGRSPGAAAPRGRSTRPMPGPGFSPAPRRTEASQAWAIIESVM